MACFNVTTGDIEEAPAVVPLTKHEVVLGEDDEIYVVLSDSASVGMASISSAPHARSEAHASSSNRLVRLPRWV